MAGNKPDETHILKYLWAFFLHTMPTILHERANMCATWIATERKRKAFQRYKIQWLRLAQNWTNTEHIFSRNIPSSNSILFNQFAEPSYANTHFVGICLCYNDGSLASSHFHFSFHVEWGKKLIRFFIDILFPSLNTFTISIKGAWKLCCSIFLVTHL